MLPFYLYIAIGLTVLLFLLAAGMNFFIRCRRSGFIANPKVGDVYLIREDSGRADTYFFVKIAGINGDSVLLYNNSMKYVEYTTRFDPADYFSEEEQISFTKCQLKAMLKNGTISTIERNYGQEKGFNKIMKG